MNWRRRCWAAGGMLAVAVGTIGIALPLLPTVPFYLLAAFCFARSNPVWEQRILDDPRFGPHVRAWREHGAIPLRGKIASIVMLSGSGVIGLLLLPGHWRFVPLTVAVLCGVWIASRPTA